MEQVFLMACVVLGSQPPSYSPHPTTTLICSPGRMLPSSNPLARPKCLHVLHSGENLSNHLPPNLNSRSTYSRLRSFQCLRSRYAHCSMTLRQTSTMTTLIDDHPDFHDFDQLFSGTSKTAEHIVTKSLSHIPLVNSLENLKIITIKLLFY